jgi:hypothetical protein
VSNTQRNTSCFICRGQVATSCRPRPVRKGRRKQSSMACSTNLLRQVSRCICVESSHFAINFSVLLLMQVRQLVSQGNYSPLIVVGAKLRKLPEKHVLTNKSKLNQRIFNQIIVEMETRQLGFTDGGERQKRKMTYGRSIPCNVTSFLRGHTSSAILLGVEPNKVVCIRPYVTSVGREAMDGTSCKDWPIFWSTSSHLRTK